MCFKRALRVANPLLIEGKKFDLGETAEAAPGTRQFLQPVWEHVFCRCSLRIYVLVTCVRNLSAQQCGCPPPVPSFPAPRNVPESRRSMS
eukprot:gene14868-biopygen17133